MLIHSEVYLYFVALLCPLEGKAKNKIIGMYTYKYVPY